MTNKTQSNKMKQVEITPQRHLTEREIQNLEEQFPYFAETSIRQAFFDALSSGNSVLIVENGELVEVFPDGEKKRIRKMEPRVSVVKGTRF
ncbi:MAG: hypothetical protein KGP29_06095 [Proteobacteria bacterium]|nr:hypothetical protein [Pseudomonadota bacterium]